MSQPMLDKVREGWISFLDRWEWEWFGTFTFRTEEDKPPPHPEAAIKLFRFFVSNANRELHGPRWYKKIDDIQYILAIERQRRDVIHFHSLMRRVGNLKRVKYMDLWDRLAGFARIQPIRVKDAVHRYVTKYVIKGGELELGGNWYDDKQIPIFPEDRPERQPRRRCPAKLRSKVSNQPLLDRKAGGTAEA